MLFIDSERHISSTKLYASDTKGSNNKLEMYFFDLECQMENNKICRDLVCTDIACEKGRQNKCFS